MPRAIHAKSPAASVTAAATFSAVRRVSLWVARSWAEAPLSTEPPRQEAQSDRHYLWRRRARSGDLRARRPGNIPHLMKELIPQASFFTQVMNQGILGHYVATASLATGVYETLNNFSAVPPEHPTVFEYFRKDLKRPILRRLGSRAQQRLQPDRRKRLPSYGAGLGATVVLPKHLLERGNSGGIDRDYDHLLHDNYETPLYAPNSWAANSSCSKLEIILKLSVEDFMAHARTVSSPDELSVYIVKTAHAAGVTQPAVDHDARHRHRSRRALTRFTSTQSVEPTGCAPNCGMRRKASRNTPGTQQCLFFPISAAMPIRMRAATASSITAPAMPPRGPRGCWPSALVCAKAWSTTIHAIHRPGPSLGAMMGFSPRWPKANR